jgi:hypothetical protein
VADKKVTVQVDINAAGNLKSNLQGIQSQIQQIQKLGGAPLGPAVRKYFGEQTTQTRSTRQQAAMAGQFIGTTEHLGLLREQIALDKQIADNTKREKIVSTAQQYAAAGGRQAFIRERIGEQAGDVRTKIADTRAYGQSIGSPEWMRLQREQIILGKEQLKNQRAEHLAGLRAKYGNAGGKAAFYGGEGLGYLGVFLKALTAASATAVGFVAAASPDALSTLTGSFRLLAGEIGMLAIPAVVEFSGLLQRVAGSAERNPRNMELLAQVTGLRHAERNLSLIGIIYDLATGAGLGGNQTAISTASHQARQMSIESVHDMIQNDASRGPMEQRLFEMQRRGFEQLLASSNRVARGVEGNRGMGP